MSTAAVELIGGGFRFGTRKVWEGVDLSVSAGEIVTVLGANGSGKSTLLRCLGGALPLESGRVLLGGLEVAAMTSRERALRVALLFQDHATALPFTVAQFVALGRTPHLDFLGRTSPEDSAIVSAALVEAGVVHLGARPFSELSGGERQLVILARALAQRAPVILMDEPTAHLDLGNQVRCLETIKRLAASGVAFVITTHDPNHAFFLSDRVVLMKAGEPVRVGPLAEIATSVRLSQIYGVEIALDVVARRAADGRTESATLCTPRFG